VLVDLESRITAADIKLPASAVLVTDPEEIVASVTEFHEEKIEEPVAAAADAAPATDAAAPAAEEKKE
jgi:hypothetical protein